MSEPTKELTESQIAAKGRELEAQRWELPEKFRLTEALVSLPPAEFRKRDPEMFALYERVKADEKRLAEMAASPYEQMSPQDAFRARAAQRAEQLRFSIEDIDQQISKAAITGEGDVDELQVTKLALRHRRAEYLAILGRYDLAAEVETDPQYQDHYLAILDAVWREDDEHCGCPDTRGSGPHANLTVPSWNAKEEIYSIKHGAIVTLMKCSNPKCNFMNAVPTPAHVLAAKAHRARAAQIAEGMSIEKAAEALTAKGHTTAKLLAAERSR